MKNRSPLPRCNLVKALASMLWPVRNMQPHPASLVRPRSSPDRDQFHADAEGRFGKLDEAVMACREEDWSTSTGEAKAE
jgi:hypothetical protein